MNWILRQSVIMIFGLICGVSLIGWTYVTKSPWMIIVTPIFTFILGGAISELGQKGKELGIVR